MPPAAGGRVAPGPLQWEKGGLGDGQGFLTRDVPRHRNWDEAKTWFLMIQSYRCRKTRRLNEDGVCDKAFLSFMPAALRALRKLEAATCLQDLRNPPSNHLEALRGDRKGQYSIRISDKWRLCFVWTQHGPSGVEIVDYH